VYLSRLLKKQWHGANRANEPRRKGPGCAE
jgi:hypothetical protein